MLAVIGTAAVGGVAFGSENLSSKRMTGNGWVACLGDKSDHGGTISATGGNATRRAGGELIAIAGATHTCPIFGHGTTPITPITIKSYAGGKLIVTYGAIAGCGAVIYPKNRKVYVEA